MAKLSVLIRSACRRNSARGRPSVNKVIALAILLQAATFCFGGAARSGVVNPGATNDMLLDKSLLILALGYDIRASKLYAVVRDTTLGSFVFGSIDQSAKKFVPIGKPLPVSSVASGLQFAIKSSNHLSGTPAHAYILRSDGLVDVDISTKKVTVDTAPHPDAPSAVGSDFLAATLYARTMSGIVQTVPATGGERLVVPYSFASGGALPFGSAIDPYHNKFFLIESGATDSLVVINELSGAVSKVPLSTSIIGLAFDASNEASSAALYGVTTCCNNRLVKIDTASGHATVIASVGGSGNSFPGGIPSDVNASDSFFSTDLTNSAIAADTSVDRSWYIESPVGEKFANLNTWMTSAGLSLGTRDASLPNGRIVNSILDFGQPWLSGGKYGATYAKMQFLPTSAIMDATIAFADGWYSGMAGNPGPSLRLIVGVNNYGSHFTRQHGIAWAATISGIQKKIAAKPYSGRVSVLAGVDIEMLYSKWPAVEAWAAGFGSNNYADFGDAQGCPGACANGWTAAKVLELGGAMFLPEIYSSGGGNAKQWAGLSALKKKTTGKPLAIVAPVSQLTACIQRAPDCTKNGRTDNSPGWAWIQLIGTLKNAVPAGATNVGPSTNIQHRVP